MLQGYIFYLPRKYLFINLNIHKVSILSIGRNEFNYLQLIREHLKILTLRNYYQFQILAHEIEAFIALECQFANREVVYKRT